MKYTKSFEDWLNIIEKVKTNPKRLIVIRGISEMDRKRKILIDTIGGSNYGSDY